MLLRKKDAAGQVNMPGASAKTIDWNSIFRIRIGMPTDAQRCGPSPLPLHAAAAWRANLLALAASGGAAALGDDMAERIRRANARPADRMSLAAKLLQETSGRWGGFWEGVAKYHAHPYRRPRARRPAFWRAGHARLLDFAPKSKGRPVIAVPSLVNSSDVLDLTPDRSVMRALARAGFRPLLLDWGEPEADAALWTPERYLEDRLLPMLDAATAADGRPALVIGYCMGGLLATALAARRPEAVERLALLATPWDFHAPSPKRARLVAGMLEPLRRAAEADGAVPPALLQTLFFALDPTLAARKYRAFARMPQDSDAARLFVAMEDWVNGGPSLAAPMADTVLHTWYGANATRNGEWRVGEAVIDNRAYLGPTLVAAPARDQIVPPESALAYAEGAESVTILKVDAGHVGMIVGHNARDGLWRPLIEWLNAT